jgi:uncharacterized protein
MAYLPRPNHLKSMNMASSTRYLLDRKSSLYLKKTPVKGRGVFCTKDIRKGEILEASPTLIMSEAETDLAQKTILRDYIFTLGKISAKMKKIMKISKIEDGCCLIMGVATFCNHDEQPNAEIQWEEIDGTVYHTLRALKAIKKNTEICTSYGEGWFDDERTQNI